MTTWVTCVSYILYCHIFSAVYCASGYEINPDVAEACLPCQRGFYKDNSEIGRKFEMCKSCGDKTTDDIAADKFDLCEYGRI